MKRQWLGIGLGTVLLAQMAAANNVVVTNVDMAVPLDGKVAVRFDLAWQNSWRDNTNYDACRVFLKYNLEGTDTLLNEYNDGEWVACAGRDKKSVFRRFGHGRRRNQPKRLTECFHSSPKV